MKNLSILGSTGSIGRSALSVVDLHPERFRVVALAAGSRVDILYEQFRKYRPRTVALADPAAARHLQELLVDTQVLAGIEGVIEAACRADVDVVVAGITGAAGLLPTYRAICENKVVALANKETLVMAGDLIMKAVAESDGALLPVDSEHSALHQCLRGATSEDICRLLLTASGGPFLKRSKDELEKVTVSEALNHPTWDMGPKITVDSATLMNKGLEVIEAHHLFGVPGEKISIVVHPQSVVHSMVEFVDGNVLAQMSITDMRSAILYALTYPERWASNLPMLNVFALPSLEFFPPDTEKFPCVRLAYTALQLGKTYPAALNASNEVAVECFLSGQIPFTRIADVIEEVLNRHRPSEVSDLETVLEADRTARLEARRQIEAPDSRRAFRPGAGRGR